MRIFFLFFAMLLFSCTNKSVVKSDIVFKIQNKELFRTNILELKVTNNSKINNYFICFDTTSIYYNGGLNYKTNDCVHPRPVFYLDNDSVGGGYIAHNMVKPMFLDTANSNCIKRDLQFQKAYLDDLRKLKKVIQIKSQTSIIIKFAFNNSHMRCYDRYTYLREKGNYEIQFKYKMNKNYFNGIVDKKLLLDLESKRIKPYYGEIISNKVPYILK